MLLVRTKIAEVVDHQFSTVDSLSTHCCAFITNGVSLTYCLHTLCDCACSILTVMESQKILKLMQTRNQS